MSNANPFAASPSPRQALIGIGVFGIAALTIFQPFEPMGQLACYSLAVGALLVGAVPLQPSAESASPRRASRDTPARTRATPARPTADPRLTARRHWDAAAQHHDRVLTAYGTYELDPAMLLQYPALWDLTATEVMDFHDALAMAGALRTDEFPDDNLDHAGDYIEAVDTLRTAWAIADRHARSTGTDGLGADDARDCRRALKLLRHADGARGRERATYLGQVITTVNRLTDRGVVAAAPKISADLAAKVQLAIDA